MCLIVVPGLWDSSSVVTLKMSCRGLVVQQAYIDGPPAVSSGNVVYQMEGISRQRILLA